MKPFMNPDHPHPAYHCGRALALFARLQRAALGKVGAGVVQRYYTATSQTPGLILGRLAANAKNHLGKLNGGLAGWYENQLADIFGVGRQFLVAPFQVIFFRVQVESFGIFHVPAFHECALIG